MKSARALPEPVVAVKRDSVKSPNFISIYANDVQVQVTPWDIRLILGELTAPPTPDAPVAVITQLADLRMSLQLAKRLTSILIEQLKAYEQQFGEIPRLPRD